MESSILICLKEFYAEGQNHPLQNIHARFDIVDAEKRFIPIHQTKFPSYDQRTGSVCFMMRLIQGRQITITINIKENKTDYIHTTKIETLLLYADRISREVVYVQYKFTNNGHAVISIELILLSNNNHKLQRANKARIYEHDDHEFLTKYFTSTPSACNICGGVLWDHEKSVYQGQSYDSIAQKECIYGTDVFIEPALKNLLNQPIALEQYQHDSNHLLVPYEHDAYGVVAHPKCQSKMAYSCNCGQPGFEKSKERRNLNKCYMNNLYEVRNSTEELENKYKIIGDTSREFEKRNGYVNGRHNSNGTKKQYELIEFSNQNKLNEFSNSSDRTNILSRLKLQAKIGEGGSSSVYLVEYEKRNFALKTIVRKSENDATVYRYAKRERDILELSRQCPFIVKLYATFHEGHYFHFLLEYAPCGSFYDFLSIVRPQFNQECIRWFSGQIVCALQYLHSKLIIYRDLKPENVLLMSNGRIKLSDFDLSKVLTHRTQRALTLCGTAEYTAPEIFRGLSYSFPVDYWSLGIFIYEMMEFRTPFQQTKQSTIEKNVIYNDVQYPAHISFSLRTLLNGLLNKSPEKRFRMREIKSSGFYSSPYTIEEIERGKSICPWPTPISSHLVKESSSKENVNLSKLQERFANGKLIKDHDKFQNFSFEDFS